MSAFFAFIGFAAKQSAQQTQQFAQVGFLFSGLFLNGGFLRNGLRKGGNHREHHAERHEQGYVLFHDLFLLSMIVVPLMMGQRFVLPAMSANEGTNRSYHFHSGVAFSVLHLPQSSDRFLR